MHTSCSAFEGPHATEGVVNTSSFQTTMLSEAQAQGGDSRDKQKYASYYVHLSRNRNMQPVRSAQPERLDMCTCGHPSWHAKRTLPQARRAPVACRRLWAEAPGPCVLLLSSKTLRQQGLNLASQRATSACR